MITAKPVINMLDHLFAPLMLEIDVNIRRLIAFSRDKALEQKVNTGRIDRRHAKHITDRRIGRRASALA